MAVPNCSSYSLAPCFYTGELAVEIKDGVRNGISTRGEAAFPVKTQSRATAITAVRETANGKHTQNTPRKKLLSVVGFPSFC